jgi:hypothetical protein
VSRGLGRGNEFPDTIKSGKFLYHLSDSKPIKMILTILYIYIIDTTVKDVEGHHFKRSLGDWLKFVKFLREYRMAVPRRSVKKTCLDYPQGLSAV